MFQVLPVGGQNDGAVDDLLSAQGLDVHGARRDGDLTTLDADESHIHVCQTTGCNVLRYAIRPDGTQRWIFDVPEAVSGSAVIAADNTLYFGARDRNLYALNAATGAVDHAGIYFNHQGKPAHRTDLPLATRWLGWPAWRTVDALTGACFGLRRAVWQKLGGFDEAFVNGGEDIDLALRASAAGLHHYVALRSVVRHHISSSAGRKLRDEQNTYRLVRRWAEPIAALAAKDWSRQQVIIHADQSGVFDYHQVQAALLHLLVLPSPPPSVRAGVAAAMGHELRRWHELLEGAAPPPSPPPVRTDQI